MEQSPTVGKYRLIRKIASGGMAEVFLAKAAGPQGFEKKLVIKRILPQFAADEQFVEMFLQEARLAALLSHPNIVQIFDFGEADDTYFMAMEWVDGSPLSVVRNKAREKQRPIPPLLCAKIMSLACEGLSYAHEFISDSGTLLNLVHRDMSPDNILVSRNGSVKILDFGIAKAASQTPHTRVGVLKGKVSYMSPEQVRCLPLDGRSDIFSLGVVLYEMLTSKRPFEGEPWVVMSAIVHGDAVPVETRNVEVPLPLRNIIAKALAKDLGARYSSCRQMQTDLDRYILSSGHSVNAFEIQQFLLEIDALPPVEVSNPRSPVLEEEPSTDANLPASASRRIKKALPKRSLQNRRFWILLLSAGGVTSVAVIAAFFLMTHIKQPSEPVLREGIRVATPAVPVPRTASENLPSIATAVVAPPVFHPPKKVMPTVALVRASAVPAREPANSRPAQLSVEFRVRPYATVFLDGQELGQTPFSPVQVGVGPHRIRLLNPELSKDVTVDFRVTAQSKVFRYNLEQ